MFNFPSIRKFLCFTVLRFGNFRFSAFLVLLTLAWIGADSRFAEFAAAQDVVVEVNQVLDKNCIPGAAPDWNTNAFTVAMRFRPLSPGTDSTFESGMLFNVGSGWFDGFRAYYAYGKNQKIYFQIGRAKEKTAVQALSESTPIFGILNDLVCTYDGKKLRLYLNGVLESETEFTDGLSPVTPGFWVGGSCYGIGSVKMFVDRLEYWKEAKDADFVKERYAAHPPKEKAQLALWHGLQFTKKLDDFKTPISKFEKLAESGDEFALMYSVRENFLNRFAAAENWEKALPLLGKMTEELLARPVSETETTAQESARISDIFTLLFVWEKVPADLLSEEQKAQKEAFFAKVQRERKILEKIYSLDSQMGERTAKIEAECFANWQKFSRGVRLVPEKLLRKFWIAPNGCDENPGTALRPFQSLKKALETAGELQKEGISSEIIVQDGLYQCRETAEIVREALLPENSASIYVHPAEGAKPVFTFGQDLRGAAPVTDAEIQARLPESARSQVLAVSLLRNGVTDFGTFGDRGYPVSDEMKPWTDFYVNGEALTLARYPNAGEEDLQIGSVVPEGSRSGGKALSRKFSCTDPRVKGWKWEKGAGADSIGSDIWAYGLWQWEWASHTVPVLDFDAEKELLTVDAQTNGRFKFHFLNVLEELDQPGEYWLDRKKGILCFIPPKGTDLKNARLDFPLTDAAFVRLTNAQNVLLEGLTFTCTRGTALWMEGCESVYFASGTISRCGVHGAVMNQGHDCGIFDTEIVSVGSCGVRSAGGNRDTLEPCRHFVSNCHIHNFCRIDRSYAPAVHAEGVGIVLTQNLVYDSPHHAFRTEGNDLLIARNEVHSVVYDFSDQSGIDIYCDPTYRGIVINENFWHHIGSKLALCGQAGIRLDDSISGVVMNGNVFYRSAGGFFGGIQIHGGKDNLVYRNLFLDCQSGISFSAWMNNRYLETFVEGSFKARVKPYQDLGIYPFMEEITEHINRNYILENDFFECRSFVSRNEQFQIYAGNRNLAASEEPKVRENGLASPQELRRWVGTFPGREMERIGIQPSPRFPNGQAGISHDISPNYFSLESEKEK